MKISEKVHETHIFLFAAKWMRLSIPEFSRLTQPLYNLLEGTYKNVGSRAIGLVNNIKLSQSFTEMNTEAFNCPRDQLAKSTDHFHPKPRHHSCLFSDASDTHWATVFIHIPECEVRKEVDD